MSNKKVNTKHKDTLFKLIFGEHKENALSLYNAINQSDYTDVDQLRIITLEDALYIDVKNDVGFIFHDVMTLIEQQSTYNPNMPLRGLLYFADSYKEYIADEFDKPSVIYSNKKVEIPAPRYYVFYNGKEQLEDTDLRLSDLYSGEGDIEVVAHMININIGHNETLLDACEPLKGYSELVGRIRSNKAYGLSDEEAVSNAVDACMKEGILVDILGKEKAKVENIILRGLTEEEKKEVERINLEYATEQGLEQGIMTSVDKLIANTDMNLQKACEVLGVSVADYEKYKSEEGLRKKSKSYPDAVHE